MHIEDYKPLQEAMEILCKGTGSLFSDLLEKMFDEIVQGDRETTRNVNYISQVVQNGSYTNSYRSEGESKLSGALYRLGSDLSHLVDSPLYPKADKRG